MVLSARPHGETDAILSALTFEHGRHLGLVKGGIGRRARPLLQPGNRLELTWKARLTEHLGHFAAEPHAGCSAPAARRPAAARGPRQRRGPARGGAGRARAASAALCRPAQAAGGDAGRPALARDLCPLRAAAAAGAGLRARPRALRRHRRHGRSRLSSRRAPAARSAAAAAGDLAARLLPLPPFLVADVPATFADVARGAAAVGPLPGQAACSPPPTAPCPPPASG